MAAQSKEWSGSEGLCYNAATSGPTALISGYLDPFHDGLLGLTDLTTCYYKDPNKGLLRAL